MPTDAIIGLGSFALAALIWLWQDERKTFRAIRRARALRGPDWRSEAPAWSNPRRRP